LEDVDFPSIKYCSSQTGRSLEKIFLSLTIEVNQPSYEWLNKKDFSVGFDYGRSSSTLKNETEDKRAPKRVFSNKRLLK
jgi:hypothetical protein